MRNAEQWVRGLVEAHLAAERARVLARAGGGEAETQERQASRARAALGGGEPREALAEARATGAVDASSHAALLWHLAQVAEAEVVARSGLELALRADERAVLAGNERTLGDLVRDVRQAAAEPSRVSLAALVARQARDRDARLEVLGDAAERAGQIRSRGGPAPDAAPDSLRGACSALLERTDDAAADLVARAEHELRGTPPSLIRRVRALTLPDLDAIATPRGRSRRVESVFTALDLGRELARRVEARRGVLLDARPVVTCARGRATVVSPGVELGVESERRMLGAAATALARALASPSLPVEHDAPPAGSAAQAIGALFEQLFADARLAGRVLDCGERERARIAVACAAACVLEARHACAHVLSDASARADDATRELAARALRLDPALVPIELALPSRQGVGELETRARAALAALAWVPALRDRYDEDFFRNPRLADFLRGAAARGGTVSAETLCAELGTAPEHAVRRVVELAERASG